MSSNGSSFLNAHEKWFPKICEISARKFNDRKFTYETGRLITASSADRRIMTR